MWYENDITIGVACISSDDFMRIFAGAFPDPTYDKLMQIDGGVMGYAGYFQELKEQGILN